MSFLGLDSETISDAITRLAGYGDHVLARLDNIAEGVHREVTEDTWFIREFSLDMVQNVNNFVSIPKPVGSAWIIQQLAIEYENGLGQAAGVFYASSLYLGKATGVGQTTPLWNQISNGSSGGAMGGLNGGKIYVPPNVDSVTFRHIENLAAPVRLLGSLQGIALIEGD